MADKVIGSAYVRIRALTNNIEKDIKKALNKDLNNLGKNIGDSISESISKGLQGVKVDAANMIDTSSADDAAKKMVNDVQKALEDIDTKVEIAVEASREALEKTKHDIEEVVEESNGQEVEIAPSVSAPAARYVSGRLSWLARTRFVRFVTQLDSKSFATTLAALSGARAIGQSLSSIWDAFKNIDRNILKIGTLASAIVYAGGAVTALVSNISSLALGLLQISGIAAPLVGVLGGFAFGMGALIAAFKDAPVYLRDVGEAFKDIQDNISAAFWSRAEEPIRRLINTLLPELDAGLSDTGGALGDFFASLSNDLGSSLVGSVAEMFDNLVWSIQIAKNSTADMASSLEILGKHGSEYLPRMADWWVRINDQFNNFLATAEADGSLERWTETAIDNIAAVGDILKGAVRIIYELGDAAAEAGGASLQALGDGLNNIADIIGNEPFRTGLVNVFSAAHEMLDTIGTKSGPAVERFFQNFAVTISSTFQTVDDSIGTVLDNLFTALGDSRFQGALQGMVEGLTEGLAGFSEFLPEIGDGFAALMDIVGTLGRDTLPLIGSSLAAVSDIIVPLSPVIQALVTAFSGALGIFTQLPAPIQLVALGFLAIKGNLGGLGTAFSNIVKKLGNFRTEMSYAPNLMATFKNRVQEAAGQTQLLAGHSGKMATGMRTAAGAIKVVGTALKTAFVASGVGIAIALITEGIGTIARTGQEAQGRIDALVGSLDQASGAYTKLSDQAIAQSFLDNNGDMVIAAQELGYSLNDLVQMYKGEAPEALAQFKSEQDALGDAFVESAGWWNDGHQSASRFFDVLDGGQEEIQSARDEIENMNTVTGENADANLTAAEAAELLADKYGEAARQIDIQVNSLEELIRLREEEAGKARDAVSSYNDLQDSLSGLNEIAAGAEDVWQDNLSVFENIRQNPALGETVEEMGNLAESAVGAALAMADTGASTEDVQNAMGDAWAAFMETADAIGINEDAARDLAVQYGLIPADLVTDVSLDTDSAILNLGGLEAVINSSEGTVTIDGDTYSANVALGEFLETTEGPDGTAVVTIDGTTFPANMKLAELIELTGNTELMALLDADPAPANEAVNEVVNAVNNAGPVMSIDGDTTLAENSRLDMAETIYNTVATLGIDATNQEAMDQLTSTVTAIDNATGWVDIDGDGKLSRQELAMVVRDVDGTLATMDIDGDGKLSLIELAEVKNRINNSKGTIDIYAADHTASTVYAILGRIPSTKTITVRAVAARNNAQTFMANGGILNGAGLQTFASGGLRLGEHHKAMLARANGQVRIWAEPETGGEAYIPLAASKRKRSLDLWKTVGKMFGVLPKNFANGGLNEGRSSIREYSSSATSLTSAPVTHNYYVTIDAKDLQGLKTIERLTKQLRLTSRQGQGQGSY